MPTLVPASDFTGAQGRYATMLRLMEAQAPMVRQLLGRLAAGGGCTAMVGTAEQGGDEMLRWSRDCSAGGWFSPRQACW